MSMYNTDCICLECKRKEYEREDYREAVDADLAEIRKGNYKFEGIGYTAIIIDEKD